jgi:hypothetical protein
VSASSTLVKPAHISVPDFHHSYGDEVADLGRMVGFGPDPEQELVLEGKFAVDRYGKSAAFEVAVIACRQNLKTGVKKLAALGDLFIMDKRLVVWSAHEFGTAQEAFRDLEMLIEGSEFLSRRVKKIHRGNGDEQIELVGDRRLMFRARTKGGGRGLTGDEVYLDEAFALQASHMGALLPTLSARPDPQVFYGSSAALANSDVLRGVVKRGRAGRDRRLAYYEWCAPDPKDLCADGENCSHALDTPGCGCDKPEYWQYGNPAMGRRITVEYIAAERRALPPEEFGRERMGWHDAPAAGSAPISVDNWNDRHDPKSKPLAPVAIALAIAPDRSSSAIAAAGRRTDGKTHVEITSRDGKADHRAGTGWVLDRIEAIQKNIGPCVLVINPAGQAGSLETDLVERGWKIEKDPDKPVEKRLHLMGTREYAQACGALVDDIDNDGLAHLGQKPLTDAVEGARARDLADAYAWSYKHSAADIAPLEAITLARHGHATYGVTTPIEPFFIR